jgi:integrase
MPTIARLWTAYDEANAERRMRGTDAGYFKNHIAALFADKTPDEITTLDIDKLRIAKLKKLSPQTTKQILAFLRRIINNGVKKGPMPDPGHLHFTFPRVDNLKTENLTREKMLTYLQALDEEPDQNAAAFLRLALSTGMRKGALMALQAKCSGPWTEQRRRLRLSDNRQPQTDGGYMTKRLADWLEKVSVAALAVGVFQGQTWGLWVAVICLATSLVFTKLIDRGIL